LWSEPDDKRCGSELEGGRSPGNRESEGLKAVCHKGIKASAGVAQHLVALAAGALKEASCPVIQH
jgi:hypothetical protein